MIHEVWIYQVVPKASATQWQEIADWLRRIAGEFAKDELVIDAWGIRSETGNYEQFNTARLVIEYESITKRDEFYSKGMSDGLISLWGEALEKEYIAEKFAHQYFAVYK